MIIIPPGVLGDAPARLVIRRSAFFVPIVHRQHDDAARTGQHLLRVGAPLLIALQPRHFAGAAVGQPGPKFRGMRRGDAGGNAAHLETKLVGERGELCFHVTVCHEKARRASAITASAAASCARVEESRVNCAAPS